SPGTTSSSRASPVLAAAASLPPLLLGNQAGAAAAGAQRPRPGTPGRWLALRRCCRRIRPDWTATRLRSQPGRRVLATVARVRDRLRRCLARLQLARLPGLPRRLALVRTARGMIGKAAAFDLSRA